MQTALHFDLRKSWDKMIKERKVVTVSKAKTLIAHTVNENPIPGLANRDQLEKFFKFSHNGHHYVFNSYIPDEILPVEAGMERLA
jgi:hypothetical protein